MTDAPPTDDREPARVVAEMIDHVLPPGGDLDRLGRPAGALGRSDLHPA
ncbi:hypothetical protein OHB01_00405 [Microbispora hainanensis]|jgi:hypothetical protein|uniref:Uncharacterized protein n=1 Tax=Microbispora hainanensis TaxID=568844 RepID=A0ABZ1SU57_9ACTN|nr:MULTISPECIES: hypothetical protein [Microbispora]